MTRTTTTNNATAPMDNYDTIHSLLAQLQDIQEECSMSAAENSGSTNYLQKPHASLGKSLSSSCDFGASGTSDLSFREAQLDDLEARLANITSLIRSELPVARTT